MLTQAKNLAIIPARGGSKRFPRKNLAILDGRALIDHTIHAAVDSKLFTNVCVSSEDDEILQAASRWGEDVINLHKRKPELATDTATVWQVCLEVLNVFVKRGWKYDRFAVLLPTSPLRTYQDIRDAFKVFDQGDADTLMSVTQYPYPPQYALTVEDSVKPYDVEQIHNKQLKPLYRHDGAIIITRVDWFKKNKEFYGGKVVPFFMPPERSVDIDTPIDLEWAEFLLSKARR